MEKPPAELKTGIVINKHMELYLEATPLAMGGSSNTPHNEYFSIFYFTNDMLMILLIQFFGKYFRFCQLP